MKRILAVVAALVLVASLSSAQMTPEKGKMSWGIGAEISIPTGDWGDAVGFGFGGSGRFQYMLENNIGLYGQLGYLTWGEKDLGGVKTKGSAFTILGGGKYYFQGGFYAMAELGIYSASIDATVTIPGFGTFSGESSSSEFVLAPGVGYEMGAIDICAKYVINGDISNIGVRVGYNFAL